MKLILAGIFALIYVVSMGLHGRRGEKHFAWTVIIYAFGVLSLALTGYSLAELFQPAVKTQEATTPPATAVPDKVRPAPPDDDALTKVDEYVELRTRDIRLIQAALYEKGCFNDEVDGVWGARTTAAAERFNARNVSSISTSGPRIEDLKVIMSDMSFACVSLEESCFRFNGELRCE